MDNNRRKACLAYCFQKELLWILGVVKLPLIPLSWSNINITPENGITCLVKHIRQQISCNTIVEGVLILVSIENGMEIEFRGKSLELVLSNRSVIDVFEQNTGTIPKEISKFFFVFHSLIEKLLILNCEIAINVYLPSE